ncbi:MAG: hypothetical protein ACI87E_000893, partial [Mariniblastus sp.]
MDKIGHKFKIAVWRPNAICDEQELFPRIDPS